MQVILAPIISEKSMNQAGKGKFTFRVEKTADKIQIRKEIEDKFKVNVLSVATSMVKGKREDLVQEEQRFSFRDGKRQP